MQPPPGWFEIAVLAVHSRSAHCRMLYGGGEIRFRVPSVWTLVPGEIALVRNMEHGTKAPQVKVELVRIDADALGLTPLQVKNCGPWDPSEQEYFQKPKEKWAKAIAAWGPRSEFEMEQVLPGVTSEDPYNSDPIGRAVDCVESANSAGARVILMDTCRADLRCLDAHAHLGNMAYDRRPRDAMRHYEVGFRIGQLSLREMGDGLLSWGWIDNRPFLRCMHGFGLCLWRMRQFQDALELFNRMLWLNPGDNQGVRFLIDDVRHKVLWEKRSEQ